MNTFLPLRRQVTSSTVGIWKISRLIALFNSLGSRQSQGSVFLLQNHKIVYPVCGFVDLLYDLVFLHQIKVEFQSVLQPKWNSSRWFFHWHCVLSTTVWYSSSKQPSPLHTSLCVLLILSVVTASRPFTH